ncbi:MAG: hypothetical protein IKV82_08390 [Akkermansia sp.]|nr:hypothetical protein [Akkermansia sp.]
MKLHLPKALFTAVLAAFAVSQTTWAETTQETTISAIPTDEATAATGDLLWSCINGSITSNLPVDAVVDNKLTVEENGTVTAENGQTGIKMSIGSSSTSGFTVSFTLSSIQKLDDWQNVLSMGTSNGNNGTNEAMIQKNGAGNLMIYADSFGGGTTSGEYSIGNANDLVGKTLTFTFDGSYLSAYVDGRLTQAVKYSYTENATPQTALTAMALGSNLAGNGRNACELSYDNIGIWDSAMSLGEVMAYAGTSEGIYTTTLTGTVVAGDTTWQSGENTVSFADLPLSTSGTVLNLNAGAEGATLVVDAGTSLPEMWVSSGDVTLQSQGDGFVSLDKVVVGSGSSFILNGNAQISDIAALGDFVIAQSGNLSASGNISALLGAATGTGTISIADGSTAVCDGTTYNGIGINTGTNSDFAGTIDVAASKTLVYGNNQNQSLSLDEATVKLNAGSMLLVNAHGATLGTLDVQDNAILKTCDSDGKTSAALTIGEVKIAAGKSLDTQTAWEGMMVFDKLNAEGTLNHNTPSSKAPLVIKAIEKSGAINITNSKGQLTLGEAGVNSVLNIGGTITNKGTLILADAGVVLNVNVGMDKFAGFIEPDENSTVWDVAANKASETGNGFMSGSGYMQVISNTGTIKVGDTAVDDLSTLNVTYNGSDTTMDTKGRIHVSGGVSNHYIIGGTGDDATVAMSTILADAGVANVAVRTVTLNNGTTLTMDTAHTLNTLNVIGTSATIGGTQKLTVDTLSAATSTVYANTSMDLGDKAHSVSKLEIGYGATVTSTQSGSGTGNGFVTGAVTVNGGGTLALSGLDAMGYSGGDFVDNLTLAGSDGKLATLKLGKRNTVMGTTINLQGNTRILCTNDDAKGANETNADKASLDTFTSGGVTFNISGTNNESEVGLLLRTNLTLSLADGATFEQKGSIYNTGKLIVTGKGQVTLSETSQYSGGTDISKATVIAKKANALGSGKVNITDGGTLDLDQYSGEHGISGINLSGGSTLTVRNGWNGNGLNTEILIDGTNTLLSGWGGNNGKVQGTINGKGTLQLQQLISGGAPTGDTWKLESTISDKSDTEKLAITSDANVTLNGTNTYSGGTEITGKTLTTASEKALGEGTVTVKGGTLKQDAALSVTALDYQSGTVNNNGNNLTVGDLTVGSTQLAMTGAGTTTVTGTLTVANTEAFTMEGALVLTGATVDLSGFTVDTTTAQQEYVYTLGTATGGITRDEIIKFENLTVEGYNIDITTMPVTSESGIAMAAEGDTTALVLKLTANQPAEQPLDKLTITGGSYDATSGVLTFATDKAVTDNLASTIEVTMSDEVWNGILEEYTTLPDTVLVSFQGKDSEQLFDFNNGSTIPTITINGEGAKDGNQVLSGEGTIVGNYVTAYIPEPTTTTLSLLALAGLAVRRRRASR